MACGSCGGGGGAPRQVKVVNETNTVQPLNARPLPVQRQVKNRVNRCTTCSSLTMLVNINGMERTQCVNPACRLVQ